MTNAPTTRQTHVIRIVGTNKKGDVLQDLWADVERIDLAKPVTQLLTNDWQGHQYKLLWLDDPTKDDYEPDGNPARKLVIIKVCDPDSNDVDDPDEWIPIPIIKIMKSRGANTQVNGMGIQHQHQTYDGDDEDSTTARVFKVRKIVHYDTNIDDAAQTAFDADPMLKAFVVKGSDYTRDDDTKDDSQFVQHEIATYLKRKASDTDTTHGAVHQGQQVFLLNQYLIDESEESDDTATTGRNGINPPYRLDIGQNIININFGLAVEFFDGAGGE